MCLKIKELFSSAAILHASYNDIESDNTDVVVELNDGNRYIAPFFAYNNIDKLIVEHKQSGDYLKGKYFCVRNMVLIDECSEENIRKVVQHLIDEGEFLLLFKRISK